MAPAGTPSRSSSARTASARRADSFRLKAGEPVRSALPTSESRAEPVLRNDRAASSTTFRPSGGSSARFQAKNTQ